MSLPTGVFQLSKVCSKFRTYSPASLQYASFCSGVETIPGPLTMRLTTNPNPNPLTRPAGVPDKLHGVPAGCRRDSGLQDDEDLAGPQAPQGHVQDAGHAGRSPTLTQ